MYCRLRNTRPVCGRINYTNPISLPPQYDLKLYVTLKSQLVPIQLKGWPSPCTSQIFHPTEIKPPLSSNVLWSEYTYFIGFTDGPIINNLSLVDNHIMTCSVDGDPQLNITWSANQNFAIVDGNQLDVCGLAVVQGWISNGLGLGEDDLTLELECTASSKNKKTSMTKTITQSRRAFKDACKSTRATQAPGSIITRRVITSYCQIQLTLCSLNGRGESNML